MIKVLFYVLCYLAIGILLQMLVLLIFKVIRMRISDGINLGIENMYHSDLRFTEGDVDELFDIRKVYLWINILVWPLNIFLMIHNVIQILLEKVFRA